MLPRGDVKIGFRAQAHRLAEAAENLPDYSLTLPSWTVTDDEWTMPAVLPRDRKKNFGDRLGYIHSKDPAAFHASLDIEAAERLIDKNLSNEVFEEFVALIRNHWREYLQHREPPITNEAELVLDKTFYNYGSGFLQVLWGKGSNETTSKTINQDAVSFITLISRDCRGADGVLNGDKVLRFGLNSEDQGLVACILAEVSSAQKALPEPTISEEELEKAAERDRAMVAGHWDAYLGSRQPLNTDLTLDTAFYGHSVDFLRLVVARGGDMFTHNSFTQYAKSLIAIINRDCHGEDGALNGAVVLQSGLRDEDPGLEKLIMDVAQAFPR